MPMRLLLLAGMLITMPALAARCVAESGAATTALVRLALFGAAAGGFFVARRVGAAGRIVIARGVGARFGRVVFVGHGHGFLAFRRSGVARLAHGIRWVLGRSGRELGRSLSSGARCECNET